MDVYIIKVFWSEPTKLSPKDQQTWTQSLCQATLYKEYNVGSGLLKYLP